MGEYLLELYEFICVHIFKLSYMILLINKIHVIQTRRVIFLTDLLKHQVNPDQRKQRLAFRIYRTCTLKCYHKVENM